MAGNIVIDNERVPDSELEKLVEFQFEPSQSTRSVQVGSEQSSDLIGKGLFLLLANLPDKKCSIPRDQIFSLLALCNSNHGIQVDYAISSQGLARNILRHDQKTFCLCTTSMLDRKLEIRDCQPDQATATAPFAYVRFALPPDPGLGYLRYEDPWYERNFSTLLDTDNDRLSIRMWRVCRNYGGYLTIYVDPHISRTFDSAVDSITYNYVQDDRHSTEFFESPQPMHGCTIQLSHESNTCIITLSIDMLLELSRLPRSKSVDRSKLYCDRVDKDRITMWRRGSPLQLYPDYPEHLQEASDDTAEEELWDRYN
jgi:hypothetical protein